jgi:peptide/nickel transport system substrate-binding protein
MNRRAFVVGCSLAALAECGRRTSDRLEMSIVAVSQELDPYAAPNLESAELSWLYADGLTGADLSAPQNGSLCVRPPVRSIAGKTVSYAYELRRGVRWHDGTPLVARHVNDCFERLRMSAWGHQRPFSLVKRIDVHDTLHFNVTLAEDDPRFPFAFFTPIGSPGVPLVRPGRVPIGTGPFRLSERTPDTWLLEQWSGSPRGAPAVSRARLAYLADDRTQEVMLSSGETDIALFVSGDYLRVRQIPYVRRHSGVGYAIVNAAGSLSDASLREGFAAAIDRREIATKVYRGMTSSYQSVVAPAIQGSDIALAHDYNPAFAREAFRKKAPGQLEIAATSGTSEQIGLLIQEHLARVGVKASVRTYAAQLFLASEGPLRTGRFDVALFGEYFSPDPDLEATWGCDARAPSGGNFSRLCDPRLDAFARSGKLRNALEELRRQAVVVPLVESVQFVGLSGRIRGVTNPRDQMPTAFDCANWSLMGTTN